ncbi:MAG TPA: hypothetical protein VJ577_16880 [Burkholderiaceae bacterium]|nr:hypothetical protein [Burkholderiaceae bacterium]
MAEMNPAPLQPFKQAVAEKAGVEQSVVDLLFSDLRISEEKSSRPVEFLTVRRLMFSGEKRDSKLTNGPYTFEWKDLRPGLWGVLSVGINQIGKSTVLEVLLWALRGSPRGLKPEVRAWITSVDLEFTVGADHYRVTFNDFDNIPRGSLILTNRGIARTLDAFDGEEQFKAVMDALMMNRFGLQPIPNVRQDSASGEPAEYSHAWSAYAASMFIEGAHPAILGDVTMGALWWRMILLFVGLPYAGLLMSLRNAIALEQARRDPSGGKHRADQGITADIRRLEEEVARHRKTLAELGDGAVSVQRLDDLTRENVRLAKLEIEQQDQVANASRAVAALRAERDEARTVLRRLEEGTAARRVFSGLKPVCCPRCSVPFPNDRAESEETEGRCAVCDRDSAENDEASLQETLAAAKERVAELEKFEASATKTLKERESEQQRIERQRQENSETINSLERNAELLTQRRKADEDLLKALGALEDRKAAAKPAEPVAEPAHDPLEILKVAEKIADQRMKQAGADITKELDEEVLVVAKRFGFRGLESVSIQGNAIKLKVSGVTSSWSNQTTGQKLRLRIALVVAMIRLAKRTGFGHHPGVLLIDSPGSEELSEEDLLAMMSEIAQVAEESGSLQIFVSSARGELLSPAFPTDNLKTPGDNGSIF